MKENKKTIQILAVATLLIAIVCISVGFALLSQQLTITGQAKIIPANWSVHFVTEDTSTTPSTAVPYTFSNAGTSAYEAHTNADLVAADSSITAPTFNGTTFSNYNCVLTRPGDKCVYTFDVINDGDINAEVQGVTPNPYNTAALLQFAASDPTAGDATSSISAVSGAIDYNLTWDNSGAIGDAIDTGDVLNATAPNNQKTIRIEIEYKSVANQVLPTQPVIVTGRDITITFQQKNS